ncbi:hypothetical protein [Psychrobacter sp. GP33]|uniref:hypothetical protein n=1 Tax=Psychrobacter sp. GP33 TaxID=2758709 RepID=UPI0015FD1C92|nr:hypothetical protein [Psychrobacter sp. GP33]
MDSKKRQDIKSSAEHVEQHLQTLEKIDVTEILYYSQEQSFSAEEIGKVINEQRLTDLLEQSDAFLSSLNGELKDFDK